jgi:DNA-binding NarL/FixJ family response regulator
LYAGTPKDNAQDAATRGRMSRKGGRPIDEQVRAKILELHRMGLSGGRISDQVGACIKTVQKYVRQLAHAESESAK